MLGRDTVMIALVIRIEVSSSLTSGVLKSPHGSCFGLATAVAHTVS